ncbi:hypothetical protein, partial [uncultured Duncaniella sp.]|uniref:hypothetical protein n=1 Tax=uncultured Duncaniella sp. TaxID=2768039 RepID=UPI002621CA74
MPPPPSSNNIIPHLAPPTITLVGRGRAPTAVVQQHHPSPRPANNHPRREGACPHRRRPTTSSLTSPR